MERVDHAYDPIDIFGGGFAKFLVMPMLPYQIPYDLVIFLADSASLKQGIHKYASRTHA